MATRSNIAIVNQDKTITSIYCHWDGYPEYVGKILLYNYKTSNIVNELLKLGNLSQLCENMHPTESHTFEKPQSNVCVAYGRERGEKDQEAIVFDDLTEFEEDAKNSWVEYQYLFKNNKWTFRKIYATLSSLNRWKELTSEICEGK